MSPIEIVAIIVMTAYAIFKQTVVSEVPSRGRFRLAVIYGLIGAVVGGFALPHGYAGYGMLVGGLVLSGLIGVLRGYRTNVWMEPDGRTVRQGNATTILLFIGLIAAKFAMGTVAYLGHIQDGAGFGEIMVMIAIMVAFQAEIVHRRAEHLARSVPPVVFSSPV